MKVIFDFDGTLAVGSNLHIPNMHPNHSMIGLCNQLFNDGNEIVVCTARGSKSCTTLEERKNKYAWIIQQWLKDNHVQYHELSFNKEYADVYIDDRAHNVETPFLYKNLDAGFTSNKVRLFNNKIIKSTENAIAENEWYVQAQIIGIKTPHVYHVDKDTIMMEYIDGVYSLSYEDNATLLEEFKSNQPTNTKRFTDYILRIDKHCNKNSGILNSDKLSKMLLDIHEHVPTSFSHGDFSIKNLIYRNGVVYPIDPIYNKETFQSYVVDIAKNLFSILFYEKNDALYLQSFKYYQERFNLHENAMQVLVACECVRVATYNSKYTDVANNLIEAL